MTKVDEGKIGSNGRNGEEPIASWILWLLFGIVGILYVFFHGRYMAEYLDDAWILSWAYNLFEKGDTRDLVFGLLDGVGGTQLFHRTLAFIYGSIGSIFGWSRGVAFGVSKLFILVTAVVWYFIVRKLGYRKDHALAFAGIMLLLEAYFSVANKVRQEPITFFLISLSFYLFILRRYGFSGLLLGLGFEAHPYAVTGLFWILAFLTVLWPEMKKNPRFFIVGAIKFTIGGILGLAYWYLLHRGSLGAMGEAADNIGSNAFVQYFFVKRMSWRHWPELIIIASSIAVLIMRKASRRYPYVFPLLISVVLMSVVFARGNHHYIAYLYPAVILLVISAARELKLTNWLIIGLLCFQVPQYAWLFWDQRDYKHSEYMERLQEEVPVSSEMIYGHPNAWFAFQEDNFHAYGYFGRSKTPVENWPDSFIVIETSDFSRWHGKNDLARGIDQYTRQDLSEWTYWDGNPVKVYRLIRSH